MLITCERLHVQVQPAGGVIMFDTAERRGDNLKRFKGFYPRSLALTVLRVPYLLECQKLSVADQAE